MRVCVTTMRGLTLNLRVALEKGSDAGWAHSTKESPEIGILQSGPAIWFIATKGTSFRAPLAIHEDPVRAIRIADLCADPRRRKTLSLTVVQERSVCAEWSVRTDEKFWRDLSEMLHIAVHLLFEGCTKTIRRVEAASPLAEMRKAAKLLKEV